MNTHDIKLPPLPPGYKSYEFPDGGYDGDEMQAYTRVAIEPYAKRIAELEAQIEADQQGGNAKQRYDEMMKDYTEELDPIEDLRFFCSLAMRQQDWLDVEPFFDAIIADRKQHDRMLAHEWIRPALGLSEDAPYRFDFYAQEIEKLRNDSDYRKRRGEPVAWRPIDTAPTDNKRPLYLARFHEGELVELDFNGRWEYWQESYEMPHINGYAWESNNGIEEPTHWAYQDDPLPTTAPQPLSESDIPTDLDLAKCAECGAEMIHVRPGKWQHPDCPQSPRTAEPVSKTDWSNELSSWDDEDFIRIFYFHPDLANRLRKVLTEPVVTDASVKVVGKPPVPSDDEIIDTAISSGLAFRDSVGDVLCSWREDVDISEYLIDNARALLNRYGQQAQIDDSVFKGGSLVGEWMCDADAPTPEEEAEWKRLEDAKEKNTNDKDYSF